MFLAIRMLIYVAAVPIAAMLGGTYDPTTQIITLNVDTLIDVAFGAAVWLVTFWTSRVAKRNGGKT